MQRPRQYHLHLQPCRRVWVKEIALGSQVDRSPRNYGKCSGVNRKPRNPSFYNLLVTLYHNSFMRGLCIVFLPIVAFLISCRPAAAPVSISNRPATVNDVPIKKSLKELTWTGGSGRQESLNDLTGKAVILDFWATYCPPCRDEIPHLNALQAKYADSGLQVIGFNSGGLEDRPKISEFLRDTPINYEMAIPEDDLITAVFNGDDRIPQTLVINRKGQIVKKIVGFNDEIKDDLDAAVQAALNAQ
jgi:thiol-disulfide isomerase/thioredoxin